MKTLSVQVASDKLSDLVEYAIAKREPILISGNDKNAVFIVESEWHATNETLHLLSVPGMRDSIHSGLSEKLESTSKNLTW